VLRPDRETFCQLGENYNIIPVFKTVPADLETPISLYLKLASTCKESFLLESGELGEKARYSFIGSEPFLTLYTLGSDTVVQGEIGKQRHSGEDPLSVLEDILKSFHVYRFKELPAFYGGAVGYLSYEMVRWWEKIPESREKVHWPMCYFYFPRKIFIYDHRRHLLTLIYLANVKGERNERQYRERIYEQASGELEKNLLKLSRAEGNSSCLEVEELEKIGEWGKNCEKIDLQHRIPLFTRDSYVAAVHKAKEYIRAGEIFQVVLSRRVQRATSAHPFNIYRALRSLNPSPYQFYLSFPDFQMVGSSPEMLVRLEKGLAYTKPIAGTRPRGQDDKSDLFLAEELSKDEKERAEHMMLVDLGRNDLGKVCSYGSVEVSRLLEIEYFSHVMHLVSEVRGKIRPECNFADLLRAAFPAGTVSGAPKVRAMEIIAELEPISRGPYAGAVGYIGFNGDMDTCITIRTIIMSGGQAFVQAGGGIVADSDPAREFQETVNKAMALMRALELAEAGLW